MSTANVEYEIVYFKGVCGRSETIKALLTLAGAKFSVTGVDPADWFGNPAIKANTALGHLPLLRVRSSENGELIHEIPDSLAIERFIARRYNLLNVEGEFELATLEAVRSDINDVLTAFWMSFFGPPGIKGEAGQSQFKSQAETLVTFHEKLLAKNGSNGHYFGSKITIADLAATNMIKYARKMSLAEPFDAEKAPLL
ncbi:hypothetical protein GQ42DRAFT_166047, partial [Ramicandelaber brevisporus]